MNKFEKFEKLGAGSSGNVFRAIYDGKEVAIKKLKFNVDIATEIKILKELSHPNIVRVSHIIRLSMHSPKINQITLY